MKMKRFGGVDQAPLLFSERVLLVHPPIEEEMIFRFAGSVKGVTLEDRAPRNGPAISELRVEIPTPAPLSLEVLRQ